MTPASCCLVSHTLQNGIGPADANLLLAAELTRRGHPISLCSLSDPTRSAPHTESMPIGGITVPALHLAASQEWTERCKAFRDFLNGDLTELKKELNQSNEQFLKDVQAFRQLRGDELNPLPPRNSVLLTRTRRRESVGS